MYRSLPALRDLVDRHFKLSEVQSLCFDLGLDYDNLAGDTKRDRIEALIFVLDKRGRLDELIGLLEKERPNVAWSTGPPEGQPNPYRGLAAFREEDADLFFGREEVSRRLLSAVQTQSLVAVIGPSGSGKSSLVYAGLLPRLMRQGDWLVAAFRPGPRPFRALASALLPLLETDLSETDRLVETGKLADALANGDLALPAVVNRILEKSAAERLLLVTDQFEELFTLNPDEVRRRSFLDMLLGGVNAAESTEKLTHVITIRADFMSQVLADGALAELLQNRTLMLGPIAPEGLKDVVEQPAVRAGATFDSGLVERLLTDIGVGDARRPEPGNLPLLEFALTLLWERQEDGRLTHSAYEAIGRVKGALAGHADAVFAALDPAEQERARRVFMQMVQPGLGTEDTRRLATGQELGDEGWQLARELAGPEARLVVAGTDESGRETAEIIHEALIQRWGLLRDWLESDRSFRLWQERLRLLLSQWLESDEDEGALLRGAPLAEAEGWLADRPEELNAAEREFIEAGVAARETAREKELFQHRALADEQRKRAEEAEAASTRLRRRRNLAFGLAAGALILAVLAVILFGQSSRNAQQAEDNLATATVALAEAEREKLRADANAEAANNSLATAVAAQSDAEAAAALAEAAAEAEAAARAAAQADRDLAERQAQIALAQRLIAESETVRGLDRDLLYRSTLLAAEGARRLDALGLSSLEAHLSLRQNLKMIPRQTGRFQCGYEGDVIFRQDGSQLALACEIIGTRIWDLASREATSEVKEAETDLLALSPDGDFVVTAYDFGGSNGTAIVYDMNSGDELLNVNYEGPADDIALSQDGVYLAITNNFDDFTQVWEVASGQEVAFLEEEAFIYDLAFSPLDQTLLIAGDNGVSRVDLDSYRQSASPDGIKPLTDECTLSLAFSPDDTYLASRTCRDSRLTIWDFAGGGRERTLDVANYGSTSLAISPGAQYVANVTRNSSLYNSTLYVVEIVDDAGNTLVNLDPTFENPPVAFSPDGNTLAVGGALWELDSYAHAAWYQDDQEIIDVAFGPNEESLTVVSALERLDPRLDLLANPFGDLFASQSDQIERELTIRTVPLSGEPDRLEHASESQLSATTFNGNGRRLATADGSGAVHVFDTLDSIQEVATLQVEGPVEDLALSPDGEQLATAGDGRLNVWEIDTGDVVMSDSYEGFAGNIGFEVPNVFLLTLKTEIALEGTRGESQLWTARVLRFPGGGEAWSFGTSGPGAQPPPDVAVSSNGRFWANALLSDQQRILDLVDLAAGVEVGEIGHPEAGVELFAFSDEGRYLATEGQDDTVRIWDTASNREIARIDVESALDDLFISPSGRYLVTVSGRELQIWTLWLGDLVAEACARLPRNLTQTEWDNHLNSEGRTEEYKPTCPEIAPE